MISTIAGAFPERGFGGDGGPASQALLSLADLQNQCDPNQFEQTAHLSVDSSGNVYLADSGNHRIRRISPDGIITTIAGSGDRPAINARCEPTGPIGDGEPATRARLYGPSDVVIHPNGAVIIADQQNNRIRQTTSSGAMTTIAGSGLHNLYAPGIPAINSPMDWPSSLALDASGALYFAEIHGNRIGKIGADGRIATVAGTGFPGYTGDNILATSAQLKKPAGIAFDAAGNIYIADAGNHRIRRVALNGIITTIAGTGQAAFSGDGGAAGEAALNTPMDVKVDRQGNVFIADTANHRVRRIDGSGTITTVAGTGQPGRGEDGVVGPESPLNFPAGLAIDGSDDLYIVDWQNYLVRKLSFHANPSIADEGIVNSASLAPAAAPGTLVTVFGSNLSATSEATTEPLWPALLAGTALNVNGTPIPLHSVAPNRINAQLPFDVPAGKATAIVVTAAGSSAPFEFEVAEAAVGIFQLPQSRRGVVTNQDGSTNSPTNPEARGNTITVFLTGTGPVDPPVPAGVAAPLDVKSRARQTATASIGGADAEVLFLGLSPGSVGMGEANIVIPAGAEPGAEVELVLTVGGKVSNVVTISVR